MGFWNVLEVGGWGAIHLSATSGGITGVRISEDTAGFLMDQARRTGEQEWERGEGGLLAEAGAQIREYLEGRRREFDLPLDPRGTEFQRAVWKALGGIPYGETRTYGEIALAVGTPRSVRAVGAACGANPIAIVVPCHRVVAKGGGLGGYSGGLELKRRLLDLEAGAVNRLLHQA
jgi:O-6-methylguanine DNA methyltransferase